jgi:hypothetical protein
MLLYIIKWITIKNFSMEEELEKSIKEDEPRIEKEVKEEEAKEEEVKEEEVKEEEAEQLVEGKEEDKKVGAY